MAPSSMKPQDVSGPVGACGGVEGHYIGITSSNDPVNHPEHYTKGGIECIAAIEAALTPEEFRGFCKGNALKYVWRELHKKGIEDLRKAMFYLNKLTKGE